MSQILLDHSILDITVFVNQNVILMASKKYKESSMQFPWHLPQVLLSISAILTAREHFHYLLAFS